MQFILWKLYFIQFEIGIAKQLEMGIMCHLLQIQYLRRIKYYFFNYSIFFSLPFSRIKFCLS